MFGLIQSTVLLFSVLGGFGAGPSITKFCSQYRIVDRIKCSRVVSFFCVIGIIFVIIISVGMYFGAGLLAGYVFGNRQAAHGFEIGSVAVFFSGVMALATGLLSGLEKYKVNAFVSFLTAALAFVICIPATRYYGLEGALVGFSFATTVVSVITIWLAYKIYVDDGFRLTTSIKGIEKGLVKRFAIPTLLGSLTNTGVTWFSLAMLGWSNGGAYEIAAINVANQWRGAILFLPSAIGAALVPIISNSMVGEETGNAKRVLYIGILTSFSVSIIAFGGLLFFRQDIAIMYGGEFKDTGRVISVMAISAVITSMCNVMSRYVMATGEMWRSYGYDVLWSASLIGSATFLVAKAGAFGLAIAYLFAAAMQFLFQMFDGYRLLRKK